MTLIENNDSKIVNVTTCKNILAESASVVSNKESNLKLTNNENGIWNENRTTKTLIANTQNKTINNQNLTSKLRARFTKKSASPSKMSLCAWCSDDKSILKCVISLKPTLSGENLKFCSEMCITEYRKTVKGGACKLCGNIVKLTFSRNREYCSYCMDKITSKNGELHRIKNLSLEFIDQV